MRHIHVVGSLEGLPTLRLGPGQSLSGDESAALRFVPRSDGLQLTTDNTIRGVALITEPERRALFNDPGVITMGVTRLEQIRVHGCVRLLGHGNVASGHIDVRDVTVESADARHFDERPRGFGVEVVPGAFTLWNLQANAASRLTAHIDGVSVGRAGAPVLGGGVFVGGTPGGGSLIVSTLATGEIHSDGGIAVGTADRISGGVFVVHGAWVDAVVNRGSVTTYGPNDMVLDNWGTVARWQAQAKITSFGPSGIGFVNFGDLGVLRVESTIETFGLGARGFNVYDGTVRDAEFDRIVTRADGAVGIQISRPVGRIAVRNGLETFGGVGDSLLKGVITQLPATALSIKAGGSVQEIEIAGGLSSHGENVSPLECLGTINEFRVSGGLRSL